MTTSLICVCVCLESYDSSSLGFFFFKQKTAYEMRISDWSSDVCSSDLWREPFMVQKFLPDVSQGDKRIVLVDGIATGAINRLPKAGEIRSKARKSVV